MEIDVFTFKKKTLASSSALLYYIVLGEVQELQNAFQNTSSHCHFSILQKSRGSFYLLDSSED
jgi:hypothetical protein